MWALYLPLPGSTVDIGYFPDKLDDLVADWPTLTPPSDAEPRGWSAGIFEVEPLGTLRTDPADRAKLDGQRELFRTGRRTRGAFTMGAMTGGNEDVHHGTFHWAGWLKVEDRDYHLKLWIPTSSVPEIDDTIEVAVSADGSSIALDSDERFDGPPGQALVLVHPPADRPEPTKQEAVQATAARMSGLVASATEQQWLGQLSALQNLASFRAQGTMDEASFEIPKGQILSRLLAQPASPSPPPPGLQAALDALRASGALTDTEVTAILSKFGTPG
jgi:hypothetical protein